MDKRITSLVVAKMRFLRSKYGTTTCKGSRIVWVNGDYESIKSRKGRLVLSKVNAIVTQGSEVLVTPNNLADLSSYFVNTWLRDYCDRASNGIAYFDEPLELTRDGDVFVEGGLTKDTLINDYFLFGSSYGGDGIRIRAAVNNIFKEE